MSRSPWAECWHLWLVVAGMARARSDADVVIPMHLCVLFVLCVLHLRMSTYLCMYILSKLYLRVIPTPTPHQLPAWLIDIVTATLPSSSARQRHAGCEHTLLCERRCNAMQSIFVRPSNQSKQSSVPDLLC